MVERKGIGHPDSLADGIAEAVSRELSRRYMDKLGFIAHHNTDEVQIIGGESSPTFSGGTIKKPIYILLGGRATQEYDGKEFNIHGAAVKAAKEYIDKTVHNIDVEEDVIIDSRIGKGSPDLTEMYSRNRETPLSNDTSFGVGHYPYTETENLVFQLENFLNSEKTKKRMPWIGEDIKVMAFRKGDRLKVTVAIAFVGKEVEDIDDYIEKKEKTLKKIEKKAEKLTDRDFDISLNAADDEGKGSVYLTVTGTSAEMGDDGSTGRGNRTNGLITPCNSMSLEATSGKNPVAHVGKIYNVLSRRIARDVVEETEGVESATVKILSEIGSPIDEPQVVDIQIEGDAEEEEVEMEINEIVEKGLKSTEEIIDGLLEGEITTF